MMLKCWISFRNAGFRLEIHSVLSLFVCACVRPFLRTFCYTLYSISLLLYAVLRSLAVPYAVHSIVGLYVRPLNLF